MKKTFFRFWPLLYVFFLWFIFAAPFFIQHKIPYPSEYQISFFTPWNEYPEFAGPIKNNALSDVVTQLYPWKVFTIEELQKGNLPVWNPYSFSGTPHLANYQSAVFSPFNLLFFILPFIDAWSLVVLLQPLLAGIFLYWFLRTMHVSKAGSLIGSISFMFCGFITVWMAYTTLSMVVALLPLSLVTIEKIFELSSRKKRKQLISYVLLLTLSIAVSFFSGHFQMSLYICCFLLAYLLFSFLRSRNTQALLFVCLGLLAGLFISLLQIIPSLQLYQFAVRSDLFASNKEAIPWYYLVTLFAPDFFGNPVTRNDWLGHYAEWASFIGIVPLTLGFASLFHKQKRPFVLFFFFSGIVSLLLAIDTPLQKLLAATHLPIFSTSIPSRIIVLVSFSFTILAGFGFDYLRNIVQQTSAKKLFLTFLPTFVLVFLVWTSLLLLQLMPVDKSALARRNLLLSSFLFAMLFISFTFTHFVKKKFSLFLLSCLIVFLVSVDSLRFVQKWMPFEDRSALYPNTAVVAAMQKNIDNGRVYGDFNAYIDTYYRLPSIEGYDPLYSKRYGEFLETAKTGDYRPAVRSEVKLDERAKYAQRVLDILGVTLIYQPVAHSNQVWAFPVEANTKNFPTVFRDDKFAVFKNNSVLPRVKIFTNYEVISDTKKLLKRFYQEDFDYRTILLLEEEPNLPKVDKNNSTAEIVSYLPNKIMVKVQTQHPGLLFLSDSYYPQWKAVVNGKEEKILIADYTLRAVKVPQGESIVEFYYDLF